MHNYSFWADEAYVSSMAKRLILDNANLFSVLGVEGVNYQKLHILILSLSFKLFGVSEFTARLPSMIFFGLGAILIFYLLKKVSNINAAVVGSFIYAFSHLNLAYSTQAKPYSAIQTITLGTMLLIFLLTKEKRPTRIAIYNAGVALMCLAATFLHFIGFLLWILYFSFIAFNLGRTGFIRKNLYALSLLTFLFIILTLQFIVPTIDVLIKTNSVLSHNHLYQVVRLFGAEYFFIAIPAFFGFLISFSRNKVFNLIVLIYALAVMFLASFQHYIFNIRYVLSLFGILFMYFGVFWGDVASRFVKKRGWIVPVAVIAIIYLTGYKVIQYPKPYYNPNIDKYGDVQIANYKDFYAALKKLHPDYETLPVFNNTFDVEEWYFGRYSNAYFMKSVTKPRMHPVAKVMIYGSLEDFKKEMNKYPKGLVIVEDWESFLPEDIKEYVKKNLKLEYRVESLKEAPNDPWPLALYSWGM